MMAMKIWPWVILLSLAVGSAAYAQFNGCAPGFCPNGDFGRGFSPPPSGAVIPPTCSGVIDASQGCPLPMLGM